MAKRILPKKMILKEVKFDLPPVFWLTNEEQLIIKSIVIYDRLDSGFFVRRKEHVSAVTQLNDSINVYLEISLKDYIDEVSLNGRIYLRYLKPYKKFTKEEKEIFFGNPNEQKRFAYVRGDERRKQNSSYI